MNLKVAEQPFLMKIDRSSNWLTTEDIIKKIHDIVLADRRVKNIEIVDSVNISIKRV